MSFKILTDDHWWRPSEILNRQYHTFISKFECFHLLLHGIQVCILILLCIHVFALKQPTSKVYKPSDLCTTENIQHPCLFYLAIIWHFRICWKKMFFNTYVIIHCTSSSYSLIFFFFSFLLCGVSVDYKVIFSVLDFYIFANLTPISVSI